MESYIDRPAYLEKIRPFIGKSMIKVLTGQRRVGKSCLLMQVRDIIQKQDPGKRIVYINKELYEFSGITNPETLFGYLNSVAERDDSVALFIDEIQDIDSFEIVLRDLVTLKHYDIYCTGSNANLLSGELASYLGGRYIEIKVYPLSYTEFLTFHRLKDTVPVFYDYLRWGGLPYLIHLDKDHEVIGEYLKSIYSTILLKDVVARFGIRNVKFLENLVHFLADNTGSLVSAKKISDYLKSQKINISTQVVIDYLGYLESSFMIDRVKRTGIEGKKIFEIGEKFYFEDIGIRHAVTGYKTTDIHKMLENIVHLHLRIAGYQVGVGTEGSREVDFIAEKGGKRIYIQVAYMLTDPQTIEREFGILLKINDNFPKYVLTMDDLKSSTSHKGILLMHVKDFCREVTDDRK